MQAFAGVKLTLALSATVYNLLALVIAAQTALNIPVSDGNCAEVTIYNNNAVGGATIYVGGPDLNAAAENGLAIAPTLAAGGMGGSVKFGPYQTNGLPLANIWLQGSVNAATCTVLIVIG